MKVFLDTNFLIYCYDNSDAIKHEIAVGVLSTSLNRDDVVISTQVINEFIVVMTTKVKYPITIDETKNIIRKFEKNYDIREITMPDIRKAMSVCRDHKINYWDSLDYCCCS